MEAKDKFFTLYKLFWFSVYNLMLIGILSTWVFVNVRVLGNDIEINTPSAKSFARR